jgi:hypothetical protein
MDVAKIAGIFTGIAFAIGVLCDVGYFMALDLQMFPLLSYKDHLETLVFFVPLAIVPGRQMPHVRWQLFMPGWAS